MSTLIIGLILFLGGHSIAIVSPATRDALAMRLGAIGWRVAYGIVALVGLYLIVDGYAAARMHPVVLWQPPLWTRHLAALLMLPVFVFFVAAYLPGWIKKTLKHPMLVSVKLWALAHLLANGMLADVILFGSFLAWAVVDRISLKRRLQRPSLALPESKANDAIAVIVGLAIYVLFVAHLHLAWIGVAPLGG